jgi:hypothetical protein
LQPRLGACPGVRLHSLNWLLALLESIRLGWKGLTVTNTVDYFNTILIVAVKSLKALVKDHTQRSKIPNPTHRHLNFHRQEIEADQPTTTGFYDTNKHRYINRQIKACFKHIQTFGPALELAGIVKAQIFIYLIDVCDQVTKTLFEKKVLCLSVAQIYIKM